MMALNVEDLIGSMQSVHAGDRGQGIEDMRQNLRATLGQTALGPGALDGSTNVGSAAGPPGSSRPHPYKKHRSQYQSQHQQQQQQQQPYYQSQHERGQRRGSSGSSSNGGGGGGPTASGDLAYLQSNGHGAEYNIPGRNNDRNAYQHYNADGNDGQGWASTSQGMSIDSKPQGRGIYDRSGNLTLNGHHLNVNHDALGGGGAGGGRSYNSSTGSWGAGTSGSSVSGGGSSGFGGFAPAPANTPQATPSEPRGGGFFVNGDGSNGNGQYLHPPVASSSYGHGHGQNQGMGQPLDSVRESPGSLSPEPPHSNDGHGGYNRSDSNSPRRLVNGFDFTPQSTTTTTTTSNTAAPVMQQY